jgi:tRNA-guanine family transglycosylase
VHAGYYLAGNGLGETEDEWADVVATVKLDLPPQKPLFVCGVGGPRDVIKSIRLGFDVLESRYTEDATASGRALTFPWGAHQDHTHPQNSSKHAAQSQEGIVWLELQASKYKLDSKALLAGCECSTCKQHTRHVLDHAKDIYKYLIRGLRHTRYEFQPQSLTGCGIYMHFECM